MDGGAGALDIRAEVVSGRASAVEVCRATLRRIHAVDPAIGAFRTVLGERALARAAELDRRTDLDRLSLAGVPVALNDNLCTRGVVTTAGSRLLAD